MTEAENTYRRLIQSGLRARASVAEQGDEANRSLARTVRQAREDGIPHNTIAGWFGITRDGLSKWLNRWAPRNNDERSST